MNNQFIINDFEGPLDLLLHLIKKDDIDINDIKINVITKQYVDFIRQMEELNLDIASEYLVMAAELIEMKSRLLLPTLTTGDDDEENPEQELIKRLKEYEMYKEAVSSFKQLEEQRKCIYTKIPESLSCYKVPNTSISSTLSVDDLLASFEAYLKRRAQDRPLHTKITNKELSVTDCNTIILDKLTLKDTIEFSELFDIIEREYIIVFFLAVLELVKKTKITISQDKVFDKLFIKKVGV